MSITNLLTVDVEDYYHVSAFARVVARDQWGSFESRVERNTDRVLAILEAAGVRATFFVLGWIAERHPDLVRRIAAAGHELACHSYSHRLVYDLTPGEFREDTRRAKAVIESAAGVPVIGYRAPSFSITKRSLWALDMLAEEGFAYDASIFPIHHDRYGIPSAPRHAWFVRGSKGGNPASTGPEAEPLPKEELSGRAPVMSAEGKLDAGRRRSVGSESRGRGPTMSDAENDGGLLEVPASTLRFAGQNWPIGGGGYLRILPYAWTVFGIRSLNLRERQPAIVYLHPWELDPDQPRLQAPWLSRFRHYRNLHQTESRLRRLLAEFSFVPIREAMGSLKACAAG